MGRAWRPSRCASPPSKSAESSGPDEHARLAMDLGTRVEVELDNRSR